MVLKPEDFLNHDLKSINILLNIAKHFDNHSCLLKEDFLKYYHKEFPR